MWGKVTKPLYIFRVEKLLITFSLISWSQICANSNMEMQVNPPLEYRNISPTFRLSVFPSNSRMSAWLFLILGCDNDRHYPAFMNLIFISAGRHFTSPQSSMSMSSVSCRVQSQNQAVPPSLSLSWLEAKVINLLLMSVYTMMHTSATVEATDIYLI